MNEEEKKAIETLKDFDYLMLDLNENYEIISKSVEKSLNLIDRLQKELDNRIPIEKIVNKINELEKHIVDEEERTDGMCITIGEDMCVRYLKNLLFNKE